MFEVKQFIVNEDIIIQACLLKIKKSLLAVKMIIFSKLL